VTRINWPQRLIESRLDSNDRNYPFVIVFAVYSSRKPRIIYDLPFSSGLKGIWVTLKMFP